MIRRLAVAAFLTVEGIFFLMLAIVDWVTAKVNVSNRGHLVPFKVASAFYQAIVAARHGEKWSVSLMSSMHWGREACGPIKKHNE